jgi:hypothetical protein
MQSIAIFSVLPTGSLKNGFGSTVLIAARTAYIRFALRGAAYFVKHTPCDTTAFRAALNGSISRRT